VYEKKVKPDAEPGVVNASLVNGRAFQFFPAAKCAILRDLTGKYASQKVR
jgi:hypothetical protein